MTRVSSLNRYLTPELPGWLIDCSNHVNISLFAKIKYLNYFLIYNKFLLDNYAIVANFNWGGGPIGISDMKEHGEAWLAARRRRFTGQDL